MSVQLLHLGLVLYINYNDAEDNFTSGVKKVSL